MINNIIFKTLIFIILISNNDCTNVLKFKINDKSLMTEHVDQKNVFNSISALWSHFISLISPTERIEIENKSDELPNKENNIRPEQNILSEWKNVREDSSMRFQQVKSVTHRIELSGKSYIKPVSVLDCPGLCTWAGALSGCPAMAAAFCASMGPMGVSTNSEPYGRTGVYRSYSKVVFDMTCENGHPTSVLKVSEESDAGYEGPLQAVAEFDDFIHHMEGNVAHIGYMHSARPPRAIEPTFQAMRFRTCSWIWHFPYYKIETCDESGWSGFYQFGGSSFPTRTLWQNGILKETINQGHIENLWISSSADRALVNGWFPFSYKW
jgi:hypothetical protein